MRKKLLLLFFGYCILIATSIIIQSCTPKPYEAKICDATLYAYDSISVEGPDYFDESIGFRLESQYGNSLCYDPSSSLISSCYALSSCASWQNDFIPNSLTLSFDREIVFQNDTISENVDLLTIPDIQAQIEVSSIPDCDIYYINMLFSQELTEELIFLEGEYEAHVSCETSDGITFNKSRLVVFN